MDLFGGAVWISRLVRSYPCPGFVLSAVAAGTEPRVAAAQGAFNLWLLKPTNGHGGEGIQVESEVAALERQCLLSEDMLRHMITRADHLTMEQMQSADAQQELADEIKLRAEQSQERASASTTIIDREEAAKATAEAATETEGSEETNAEEAETAPAEAATTDETA